MKPKGATQLIAEFAADFDAGELPTSTREFARLSIFDWSAVLFAGLNEPVNGIIRSIVAKDGGAPVASAIGLAEKVPARQAALANGTASHALDYDDTHFDYVGHPSVAVAPAALAMAQQVGATGEELLCAFAIGAETACAIGAFLGTAHYQRGFHQTATSGSFGATAACARLAGLDVERTRHALGIAATRASGLKSQFGTMGKPFHAGMAAANGVEAATLAKAGFISRPDGIECEQGFAATHHGEAAARSLERLGTTFRLDDIRYKFHACCHGLHAALEALKEAQRREGFAASTVGSVAIRTNPRWLKVCNIGEPATALEAKFSFRLTAAMALCGRNTAAIDTYSEEGCHDGELVALRDRVKVAADEALPDTAAAVSVRLSNGKRVEAAHDIGLAMPIAGQADRLQAKARALLGNERQKTLWTAVSRMEVASSEDFAANLQQLARN